MTDLAVSEPGRKQSVVENLEPNGPGWQALLRSSHLPKLTLLCFAIWLHAANSLLAATTVPQAVAEMGGAALISWAFSLYLLGSILAGASASLISKKFGLRVSLMLAATVYGLGSLVCASAGHMEILLAGRLIQGLGGGALLALSYVALNQLFPPDLLPRAMALTSAVWSASAMCGPLIGGTFATLGLWRFGYGAFALQAGLFVLIAWRLMADPVEQSESEEVRPPIVRLVLLGSAILAISLAAASTHYIISPLLCLAGIVLIWAFLTLDGRKASGRMYPSATLQPCTIPGAGILMLFLAGGSTMSFLVYGPVMLETLFGLSPLASGYVIAFEAVAWGAAAIFSASLTHVPERTLIRAGTAIVSLGVIGLTVAMPGGSLIGVLLCAFAQGAGFGMMFAFVVRLLVSSVPADEKDTMATAIPTTQQLAFALGAAVAGIAANTVGFSDPVTIEATQAASFWVFVIFLPALLIANAAAWRLTR